MSNIMLVHTKGNENPKIEVFRDYAKAVVAGARQIAAGREAYLCWPDPGAKAGMAVEVIKVEEPTLAEYRVLHNDIDPVKPVKRFLSSESATERVQVALRNILESRKRRGQTVPAKKHDHTNPGEFKPVRAGSKYEVILRLCAEGAHITRIAEAIGTDEKEARWRLRYPIRQSHGIDYRIDEDGRCFLNLPVDRSLEDCINPSKNTATSG